MNQPVSDSNHPVIKALHHNKTGPNAADIRNAAGVLQRISHAQNQTAGSNAPDDRLLWSADNLREFAGALEKLETDAHTFRSNEVRELAGFLSDDAVEVQLTDRECAELAGALIDGGWHKVELVPVGGQ